MNDISAALGISQLKRLKIFLIKRNKIAKIYKSQLNPPFFRLQKILRHNYSSFHLVLVQLNLKKFKYSYENIFKKLRKKKFFVNLHYMPLHTNPFFFKRGFKRNSFQFLRNTVIVALVFQFILIFKLKKLLKFVNYSKVLLKKIEKKIYNWNCKLWFSIWDL